MRFNYEQPTLKGFILEVVLGLGLLGMGTLSHFSLLPLCKEETMACLAVGGTETAIALYILGRMWAHRPVNLSTFTEGPSKVWRRKNGPVIQFGDLNQTTIKKEMHYAYNFKIPELKLNAEHISKVDLDFFLAQIRTRLFIDIIDDLSYAGGDNNELSVNRFF